MLLDAKSSPEVLARLISKGLGAELIATPYPMQILLLPFTLKENRCKVTDVLDMCPLRPSLSYSSNPRSLSTKAIHCVFLVSLYVRAVSSHQMKSWCWGPLSFQLAKAWRWHSHQPASHLPMHSEKKSEPLPPYEGPWSSSRLRDWRPYFAIELIVRDLLLWGPQQDSLKVDVRAIRLELGHCASRTFPGTACIIAKRNT